MLLLLSQLNQFEQPQKQNKTKLKFVRLLLLPKNTSRPPSAVRLAAVSGSDTELLSYIASPPSDDAVESEPTV